ncbi:MAG: proline--tRNA ligase [Candidatus Omnitrophica bacterium]|nr:proline--tRNA ligase [Candidatus Omnitrophota bacterium]
MRLSKTLIPTLKEDPQEAEAVSHKLMMRSGLIRRLTSGAYIYLPLGLKVLDKARTVVREEMNRAGAVEIMMPAIQPVELWKKTGRYSVIGDVMIKFKDRHGKEVALGPTHEEVVTSLVAGEIRSYKDLPLTLYQIQTKFRDEVRPRFGIVRSCEFIMKDAYSFDVDPEAMEKSYKAMYDAYCRIFSRCGIDYIPVEADPGMMGGTLSHEFMVPAEIGEDRIVVCSSCGYAASTEVAKVMEKNSASAVMGQALPEDVSTPGMTRVEDVSAFLGVKTSDLIKTLIYLADGQTVAVLIRGDHEANETKIKNHLKAVKFELADERTILEVTGCPVGFSGPLNMVKPIRVVADHSVMRMTGAVTGANKKDTHLKNVEPMRDIKVDEYMDARVITGEDPCPKCGGKVEMKYCIEIGHTFKLGTKYSSVLGAKYLDAGGKEHPAIMGCYGIGVNRILASLIEQSHDKDGIIWPLSIAPYEVVVIPVNKDDQGVADEAEKIYKRLLDAGVDAAMDDREKSPGVKFKDADLIGYPFQIIIGKKNLDNGKIELKDRALKMPVLSEKDAAFEVLLGLIEKKRNQGSE